jgi:hypothetical protein
MCQGQFFLQVSILLLQKPQAVAGPCTTAQQTCQHENYQNVVHQNLHNIYAYQISRNLSDYPGQAAEFAAGAWIDRQTPRYFSKSCRQGKPGSHLFIAIHAALPQSLLK